MLCKKHPTSKWVVVRDTLQTLKRTTIPSFNKICPTSFIKKYNQDTQTVTFANDSQIIFLGENFADDKELNRFKGLECNGFLLEEINELQKVTFLKCIERAGSHIIPNMPKPIILATCNPCNNWVKKDIYDLWISDKLPVEWKYIPSKITDNPHIPQSYYDSLKSLPPYQYARFVEGDWNIKEVAENAFANHFNQDKHVGEVYLRENTQLLISVDFNINPFACIVGQMYRENNVEHVVIVDELSIEKGSIQKLCDELKTRYARYLPTCIITGDAMGNRGDIGQRENATLYEQMRRLLRLQSSQLKVPANPTHENSRADVNYFLYHYKNFKISNNCVNLERDLMYVEIDEYGKIKKANRKEEEQRADHLDAFRYFVNTFMKPWILSHQKHVGITNYFNK